MEPETRYFCYSIYRQKLLFVEYERLPQWQPKICPSQPYRKQPTNCFLFGMVTQWKVPDSRFVYTSCFLSKVQSKYFWKTVTDITLVDTYKALEKLVFFPAISVMGRTPFYRTSNKLEHHFSTIERTLRCSSIDERTRTPELWLRTTGHRTSNLKGLLFY